MTFSYVYRVVFTCTTSFKCVTCTYRLWQILALSGSSRQLKWRKQDTLTGTSRSYTYTYEQNKHQMASGPNRWHRRRHDNRRSTLNTRNTQYFFFARTRISQRDTACSYVSLPIYTSWLFHSCAVACSHVITHWELIRVSLPIYTSWLVHSCVVARSHVITHWELICVTFI